MLCGILVFVIIADDYLECKEWGRKIGPSSVRVITVKCLQVSTCANNF